MPAVMPKVRRHYLLFLAGIFWTIAGGILCVRGTLWLQTLSLQLEIVLVGGSALIAGTGYHFLGFSKIVHRNIDRILSLPERANVFAFTGVRGYVMIGMMMTAGIALRNSSIPKYYLILPYYVMGGVLLVGSAEFYREFIGALAGNATREH